MPVLLAIALAATTPGPAAGSQKAFDAALAALDSGSYEEAAAGFAAYLGQKSDKPAPEAEWATYFIGQALEKLGLSQGALEMYYQVAKQRSRPEVVPLALGSVERLLRKGPIDEEALLRDLIWGSDFGPQEPPVEDFVQYYQGLFDLRAGHDAWSERHFARVRADGPYGLKVKYVRAVALLKEKGDADAAAAILKSIADAKVEGDMAREVKNDARLALARIDYDAKKWDAAVAAYRSVELPELDPGMGPIYLEEAWSLYRSGDLGLAMGRLAALESPAFKKLYLPEKFLLRGLIYKDLCRWLPAKRAARDFSRVYAQSLDAVRLRENYGEVPQIMTAAMQQGALSKVSARHDALVAEEALLAEHAAVWAPSGLTARLSRAYALARAEAERAVAAETEKASSHVLDSMLSMAEQMRVLDYEIGLALYKRAKRGDGDKRYDATYEEGKDDVVYQFDGEYWNDELKDLRFSLSSRCPVEASK